VLCTVGNLNNHIGVPLTLLSLTENHEIAVIEMGAYKPGDIQELVEIAEPNVALITNIGKAHLEGFKTLEGVIKTKTELFSFVKNQNGTIVYNLDDEIILKHLENYPFKLSYGKNHEAQIVGRLIESSPYVVFDWTNKSYSSTSIRTHLIGSYNFYNFLAAISIGVYFDVPFEQINFAINSYIPTNNRSQVLKTKSNTLIIDCYNANPSSMLGALESFVSNNQPNKWAILGDMLELGEDSIPEHRKILQFCQENHLNHFTVGKIFKELNTDGFANISELEEFLISKPLSNHLILLKGSRGISLEKIIPIL
jgi:UDP-N-acetylmuramoyl-tripeptide--D-alanyl-D-alanine ligase